MPNYIWHLSHNYDDKYNVGYYQAIVVCAPTEEFARSIHPTGIPLELWKDGEQKFYIDYSGLWKSTVLRPVWVAHPSELKVVRLGLADNLIAEGTVLCADYLAE